jgi:hypothetical protein
MAAALLANAVDAETALRPPKPYAPVAITRPAPLADPDFAAFRAAIAAAAKSRIYAELETLVQPQGFFWDRDFRNRYDPRRPAVDNLAAAIGLERDNGAGWQTLAQLAAEATAQPLESRPGVVCAPAPPGYDSVEFSRLLDQTYTAPWDWAFPQSDVTTARAAPHPEAAAVGRLGLHFVRLLGVEPSQMSPATVREQWARVAMPDGQTGYVAPGSLSSLTAQRLCYIRDLVLGWRITGYIAANL